MSKTCDHFAAEPVSTTIGTQLADGRWRFERRYFCGRCNTYFSEVHEQDLERRVHERPDGPLNRRIDRIHGTLRDLREGMDGLRQALDPMEDPQTPA